MELVRDRQTREPATTEGKAITERCLQNGLIFSVRREGSVLRFVPPASTTEDQIDQALDILADALEEASR
ncbi:MAG: aminotransferase class III-fold pyridoxal phosphate-dependent enzyme [Chloroflexi bacterium]|nr:aminotransferase class III-fold pyridoxal phosphate-dependent enzyme [Chloroflexota bacterium]